MGYYIWGLGQAMEKEFNQTFNEWDERDLDVRYRRESFNSELKRLQELGKSDESWCSGIWVMHQFKSKRRRGRGNG